MGDVFDAIMSRTHGLVSARDVRVVWVDGTLYICKSPTDIVTFQTSEPKKRGGSYHVDVGEAQIRMTPPGCGSCRRRVQQSPIGQMSVAAIVEAVKGYDAVVGEGGSIGQTLNALASDG